MKNFIFAAALYIPLLGHAGNESGGIGSPVVSAINANTLQKIATVKYMSEDEDHVYFEANSLEVMKVSHKVLDSNPSLDEILSKSYLFNSLESVR